MKSWALLKESIGRIGGEVKKILLVNDDVGMLQEDLASQERLWRRAERELSHENAALRIEVEGLRAKVLEGMPHQSELEELRHQIQEATQRTRHMRQVLDGEERTRTSERSFLKRRASELASQLAAINATTEGEVQKALEQQRQAEGEAEKARAEAAALGDATAARREALDLEAKKAAAEAADLQRQIAEAQAVVAGLEAEVLPQGRLEGKLAGMRQRVANETRAIVRVKEAEAAKDSACAQGRRLRTTVRLAEEAKAQARRQEARRHCEAVRSQRQVLQQMLATCTGRPA